MIAIVGPTGVGKSALALELADEFGAEIVSADSRQVYRDLDVGTAKPSRDEQARVRHHLIDIVDPEEDFTLSEFQDRAYAAIDDILRRGRLPLLVGGTGLYVKAIVEGIELPRVAPDPELRQELEQVANEQGAEVLHRQLTGVDPRAASRIDPRNVRRVIRALEVIQKTGQPFSVGSIPRPRYKVLTIGLTQPREELYRRIDQRADLHIASGMIQETERVLARGCPPGRPALASFGYRELVAYLRGELDLPTAVERYKFETHRYARQQYSWFRLNDERIHWLEPSEQSLERARALVDNFAGPRRTGRLEAIS